MGRGNRGEPENARADCGGGHGRATHGIRRCYLHRIGGQSSAVYSGLQSESDSADFSSRREWIHGGQRSRVERNYSRGRENGERRGEQRGTEDIRDLRRQLRRWTLRDVRKSVRPAVHFRVADGALRRDGRRIGGGNAGGNQNQADGARRKKDHGKGQEGTVQIDSLDI